MSAIAGLRGTADWGADERPKNFREMIMWRNPNGTTPIHGLMARVQTESVDDPEFSWWDEPNDIWRGQVNGAVGNTAIDKTIVIDSSDPSAAAPDSNWGLAKHLKPGDVLMVELGSSETNLFPNEHLLVEQVVNDTTIICTRGFAGSTIANIANDAFLLKVGSAYAEGTAEASSTSRNPIKYYNYTQIFKTSYEVTRTASKTRARTGDLIKNEKKRKSFDHSTSIELAIMFGRRSETTGSNGKPLRTTGGIRSFIPSTHQKIYSSAVSFNTFLDDIHKVFDYDTPAGDQRICMCGNGALNELNKMAAATGDITFGERVKMLGMNLREIILPQGTLYLRTHPLMNRNALYKNSMFILDFSSFKWRTMLDTKSEDNIQAKGEDVIRGQWITEAGLEVRYGGLTNFYVGNFSAT